MTAQAAFYMTALKDALDALRPFAEIANSYGRTHPTLPGSHGVSIALEDCRRAAAAVEAIEKMQDAPPPPAGDMALVPREALNWLFGEGPDAQGHWFGDGDNPAMSRGRFWWRTNFRNMLAAAPLPAQEVSDGWQSMESAPKDGTEIIAWCRHDNWQYAKDAEERARWEGAVIAQWTNHNGGGWTWNGHCGVFVYWQPLPAPPESALRPGKVTE